MSRHKDYIDTGRYKHPYMGDREATETFIKGSDTVLSEGDKVRKITYTAQVAHDKSLCLSCDKGIDAGDMYICKSREEFGYTEYEYCISCACENIDVGRKDGILSKDKPIWIDTKLVDDKRYSGVLSRLIDYRIPLKTEVKTMTDKEVEDYDK